MTSGYGEFQWPRQGLETTNQNQELKKYIRIYKYILTHNTSQRQVYFDFQNC